MKINSHKDSRTISNPVKVTMALIITSIFLSSCTANAGYRHSGHEPAPSRSTEYHYFPNAHVNYDAHRRVHHYQHKQRGGLSGKKKPNHIDVNYHRDSVHSDHRKPWKKQHLQKKNRSHSGRHYEKSHNRRQGYQSRSPRQPIIYHQMPHHHGTSHHDRNRQHRKHRIGAYNQGESNGLGAHKRSIKNGRPVNKLTGRKTENRHKSADKKAERKMQNQQQHRKNEPHRANAKQNKNRVARNDKRSRQDGKNKRN